MKIGLFTDSYLPSPDGVATSVEVSAKELQRKGNDVFVVAPNQPHSSKKKNVYRLVSVRLLKTPEIWAGLEVPQPALFKVASLDVDIIHGHSGGPVSFLGWQLAFLHNVPFVQTYHTMWRYYRHYLPYQSPLTMWLLKRLTALTGNDCHALIAPSIKAKNELLADGVKKKIYVIPNGISLEHFRKEKRGFLHATYAIPEEKKILLTVGRLEKEKSVHFLINAFALVHYTFPDMVLVIIGDGRERESLSQLAASNGLIESCFFIKQIPYRDMPKVYADAHLFVFASQTETQGMVIVEALASGLPVIAVADAVFFNVVEDGINGYLVKKDPALFAEKVHYIMTHQNLRVKMQSYARQSAQRFSIHLTTNILENVYQEIIAEKKSRRYGWQTIFSGFNKKLAKEYLTLRELFDQSKVVNDENKSP